jgi:hypothetical protein
LLSVAGFQSPQITVSQLLTEAGANEAILGRCHAFLIELFHKVSDFFYLGRFINLTNENERRRPVLRRYTKVISAREVKRRANSGTKRGRMREGWIFARPCLFWIIFACALLPFDFLARIITPLLKTTSSGGFSAEH